MRSGHSDPGNSECRVVIEDLWLGHSRCKVDRFLEATAEHRWAVAFRLGALFGLRRSEVLALRWDDVDVEAKSLRIDESLVATNEGAAWSNAKNERSRRVNPRKSASVTVHLRS